jgi:uncharacterized protein (TIGR02246 family)
MKIIGVILLASVALSCNQPKVDTKTEGEKVMKTSAEWSKTVSTKDVEKIASYWADDAVLIAPNQPVLEGKNAIRQMVEQSFKTPGFNISWQPKQVVVSEGGEMAYIIEDSQVSFADSTGKLITTQNKAVSI